MYVLHTHIHCLGMFTPRDLVSHVPKRQFLSPLYYLARIPRGKTKENNRKQELWINMLLQCFITIETVIGQSGSDCVTLGNYTTCSLESPQEWKHTLVTTTILTRSSSMFGDTCLISDTVRGLVHCFHWKEDISRLNVWNVHWLLIY